MSKILGSECEDYANEELTAGTPYRVLSRKLLESFGFEISHSALREYHIKHLGGAVSKLDVPQSMPKIAPINMDWGTNNEAALVQACEMAIRVVQEKMREHVEGECKYPTEEIKGLKAISDLIKGDGLKMVKALDEAREKAKG